MMVYIYNVWIKNLCVYVYKYTYACIYIYVFNVVPDFKEIIRINSFKLFLLLVFIFII